ncbi:anti-sigma factor antagonist [Dyella solisilvae]|uniref:Anti-sigma factor antagonist n=1 Tax=Dyella solisilvae TaxID=1920168 RepID=A0A370K5N3_9GAMM|nr:STAS domain-containing protein [Dyella solisilvae]RDI97757.1 anti-sigma factor antagonist [Dyella solisilvae]
MGGRTKGKGEARVIALPADFRLASTADVKASLADALGASAAELDGAAVERVDSAALQLLLVFRREAAARGLALAWSGVSVAMREAADVLGLSQVLELPASMPA